MLKKYYTRLKKEYLENQNYDVPPMYQSSFVHWGGGADAQYIYNKLICDGPVKAKMLIIGVMGGRDYYYFVNKGFDVVAVDIGYQPDIEPIIIANVEENLPFLDQTFDLILIGEVLEHLRDDVRALTNLRRVLKDTGTLLVSLPFYNDWEEGHMRIHSPISGRRLLQLGGFEVVDYLERPGLFWSECLNWIQHGLSLLVYVITRHISYRWITTFIGRIEWSLGHILWLRPIRKLSMHFGGYYACKKALLYDHIDLNKRLYTKE